MPFDFSVLFGTAENTPPLRFAQARDGTHLPYRHYPAVSDLKLILIHGSASHGRYLATLAGAIAGSGAAEVFTPDLRGHGESPLVRGDIDYIEQLEDDLADLIDHIKKDAPNTRIIVGGHSSGGGLAVRFAGSPHRDVADGYLLLAPFLKHDAPTTRIDAGGWAKPKLGWIVFLSILNGFGIRWLNRTKVIEFDMPADARDGTETLAYSFRLNTGFAPRDYESDLSAMADKDAPLLVIVGANDEAFIAEAYPDVVEVHAPQGRVEILPDESHLGLVGGDAVRTPIIHWLRAQNSGPEATSRTVQT
jgi:non-heme chloroperoxidase